MSGLFFVKPQEIILPVNFHQRLLRSEWNRFIEDNPPYLGVHEGPSVQHPLVLLAVCCSTDPDSPGFCIMIAEQFVSGSSSEVAEFLLPLFVNECRLPPWAFFDLLLDFFEIHKVPISFTRVEDFPSS